MFQDAPGTMPGSDDDQSGMPPAATPGSDWSDDDKEEGADEAAPMNPPSDDPNAPLPGTGQA